MKKFLNSSESLFYHLLPRIFTLQGSTLGTTEVSISPLVVFVILQKVRKKMSDVKREKTREMIAPKLYRTEW